MRIFEIVPAAKSGLWGHAASTRRPAYTARNVIFSNSQIRHNNHPCGLSRFHPTMKGRTNTQRRLLPKLPRVPEEMRQWSDLLLREILGWPDVSSRPMFGMTAVYRGNAIFGVLPRTRAMDTSYSVSFKIPWRNPTLKKRLEADPCILPSTGDAKWISFELQSGDDLPDAIRWFAQAYRLTAKAGRT